MKNRFITLSIVTLSLTACGEAPHNHDHEGGHSHSNDEQHHHDNDESHKHHEQESFRVVKDTLESQAKNQTHEK